MTTPARATRVLLVGYGSVNRATLELAQRRPSLEVVGVVVGSRGREGERADASVPSAPDHLHLTTSLPATIARTQPDIALVATRTRLGDVLPILEVLAASGVPAICTAEELAFFRPGDSPEATRLHELVMEHGVALVATGVNPGFVLDLWPLVLSGLAWDVRRIRAHRIVDVSVFGPLVRASLGIDYELDSFEAGVRDRRIVGHAGFRESLRLVADRLGRPLDRVEIGTEPMTLGTDITLPDGSTVAAGRTVGVEQVATGWVDGEPWIELGLTLHVELASVGLVPIDEVHLIGEHDLRVRVEPGCHPIRSTAALLVNSIFTTLAADAGFYPPGALPPAAPWFGSLPRA